MRKRKKINVLFVCSYPLSTFMNMDYEILKRHFNVKLFPWRKKKEYLKKPLEFFRFLCYVFWCDITFSWFVGSHAYFLSILSKILGKKSIVVASGYCVAKLPDINYGSMLDPHMSKKINFTLKYTDVVLAVSDFNKKEILKNTLAKDVKLVYHGVCFDDYPLKGKKDNNLILTVSYLTDMQIKRKGIDTFIEAAKYLPTKRFVVVGGGSKELIQKLKSEAPLNMEFTGYLSNSRLLTFLQKAKVYVQISRHEGFGLSLAEAMLCGCVPVTTKEGAIPEVVGDTGYYVPYGNPRKTAETIRKALKSEDKGIQAREQIKKNFSLESRERELVNLVKDLY